MKELKKKVFWTLFLLLSALAIMVGAVSVSAQYFSATQDVSDQLDYLDSLASRGENRFTRSHPLDETEDLDEDEDALYGLDDQPDFFLDGPAYIVHIDRYGEYDQVWFSESDGQGLSDVAAFARLVTRNAPVGKSSPVNLLGSEYAWSQPVPDIVCLVDLEPVRHHLFTFLIRLLLLLALFEAAAVLICRKLTGWMVTPVQKALDQQKQFIADASHELKTPIAAIMASAEAMERTPDPKWPAAIKQESEQMNRLVCSLLDLTRAEQADLQTTRLNLSKLVSRQTLSSEALLYELHQSLDLDVQPDLEVDGDQMILNQIISVLLDNAAQYAHGQIRISLKAKGKSAILSVSNNGDPISEEDQKKIFERFYRVDKARNRKAGHYGLGLAIAREGATRLKGDLSVSCKEGWTTFTLTLPLATAGH